MINAKYAVFDTETTGLFQYRNKLTGEKVPADAPGQPHLASFAVVYADERGEPISSEKIFVKPDGWSIDGTEAGRVNGLTDAFLHANGQPVSTVLKVWNDIVDAGLIPAAFNAQFDCKMMRAELRRAGLPDRFEETPNICVMRALDPYGPRGLMIQRGFVKLSVACEFFGIVNTQAHDAMADAVAAQELLKILIADGFLPEAKVHFAKERA